MFMARVEVQRNQNITDSFLKAVMFMVLIINQKIHGMQKRSFLQNSRNYP